MPERNDVNNSDRELGRNENIGARDVLGSKIGLQYSNELMRLVIVGNAKST